MSRLLTLAVSAWLGLSSFALAETLLNVSYDPTRELYQEINTAFTKTITDKGRAAPDIQQSHGGSGKQARSVIDGLEADVVTLGLAYDIDQIAKAGLISPDWNKKLSHNSAPYTSTIIFLVRKGNPKNILDWSDLVRPDVKVITPNPKTSGGARWNYIAAWGYALKKFGGKTEPAQDFISKLFRNVPVLDTGARASTTTFVQRKIGDVLISWENEALLAVNQIGRDQVEIVVPSISVRAEPPVAIVDTYAKKHGTMDLARQYLEFLYTDEAQRIIEKHYFRPIKTTDNKLFPKLEMMSIDHDFGGWNKVHQEHFADGAIFDQIYGN